MSTEQQHIYFAYGSNIWKEQMRRRCKESDFIGVGILEKWRWIINVRGVANVISPKGTQDVVYGFLYTLSQADEAKLDRYEGFPHIYGKKILPVKLLTRPNPTTDGSDLGTKEEHLNALVYVDVERTDEGDIREEYIGRMRLAIADALGEGIPPEYIDKYIGKWVPIPES